MKFTISFAVACLLAGSSEAVKIRNQAAIQAKFFDIIRRDVPAVEVITDQLGGDGENIMLVPEAEAEQIAEDLVVSEGVEDALVGAEIELTREQRLARADAREREEAGVYDADTGVHETFE